MKTLKSDLINAVSIIFLALALTQNAKANIISSSNTTSPTTVDCNSFCSQFASTPTTQNSNTWGAADDQMCFLLGAPTSDDPSINVTPTKMPTLPTGMVDRCKYHNSMTEQYCLTYLAIEGNTSNKTDAGVAAQDIKQQTNAQFGSKDVNIALLTLDYAAVGACTAACFSGPASAGTLNAICGASAIGEGIFEMTQTARMASSNTAAAIDTAFAGLSMAGGVASLNRAKNAANEAGQRVVVSGEKFGEELKDMSALDKAKSNKESCTTAVMMSVVAGIRTANVIQMGQISSQACSNIQNLISQGTTLSSNLSNIQPAQTPAGSSNSNSSFGSTSALNAISQCMNSGTTSCQAGNGNCCLATLLPSATGANGSAASEGNLLSQIPSIQSALPGLNSAASAAPTNGAGSAIAGMGGGGVPSGFTGALSNIADAAQKDAQDIAKALGIGMTTAPVYASGTSQPKASSNSLFSMLMDKKEAAGLAPVKAIQFTKATQPKAQPSALPTAVAKVQYAMNDIVPPTGENTIFPQGHIQGGSDQVQSPQNPYAKFYFYLGVVALLALGFVFFKKNGND